MSVITVTNETFDQEVMQSPTPVLVDFWASWCGPCRMISPLVDEIANERNDIKVVKINIDQQLELVQRFKIVSIPTLLVVKDGELPVPCQNQRSLPCCKKSGRKSDRFC